MVVGLAAVILEFYQVFLFLFGLPWVGVLSFGSIPGFLWVGVQVLLLSFGLGWSFLRYRAPISSLLCFESPRGTPEAIVKFLT